MNVQDATGLEAYVAPPTPTPATLACHGGDNTLCLGGAGVEGRGLGSNWMPLSVPSKG